MNDYSIGFVILMKSSNSMNISCTPDTQRLDIWLWASRFFKTRKLAAEAVAGGHVAVNHSRAKPGRAVKAGDELELVKNHERYQITIAGLSPHRLSAVLAAALYDESESNQQQRLSQRELRRKNNSGVRYDRSKPDRRDRKQMLKIKTQVPDID